MEKQLETERGKYFAATDSELAGLAAMALAAPNIVFLYAGRLNLHAVSKPGFISSVLRPRQSVLRAVPVGEVCCHVAIPLIVVTVMPALLSVKRIVSGTTGIKRKPGGKPNGRVSRTVVIAEVVVAVTRTQEEMAGEHCRVDNRHRRVRESTLRKNNRIEIHRGEQDATAGNGIIVVTVDENVAARGPHVMGRNPIPIRLYSGPESGPPGVPVLLPDPTARQPGVVW